jgi:hypothetical protein
MILLPDDLRKALRANAIRHGIALRGGLAEPDFVPLLKLFNPLGASTWLASELAEDGDTLFGVADLGFGCPELGTFSLSEIAAIPLPYGRAGPARSSGRRRCSAAMARLRARRLRTLIFHRPDGG